MTRARLSQLAAVALTLCAGGATLAAQQTTPAQPSAAAPEAKPTLDFSGVIFGNYQYNTGPANHDANSFNLDRAYLTFRIPAGERTSIRVTTDVFQDAAAGSNAYTVRAKYAYLQYDVPKFADGAALLARIGILQTVEIDHEESFWPRYLTNSGVERAGFFSSADVGIASQLTLPDKFGEVYAVISNGPGYASKETDRFKDYQARLSLTPLLGSTSVPALLRTFTLTGWAYRGSIGSKFAAGGVGQIGPIGEAMPRDRYGVLVGIKDPRLTVAGEYGRATSGTESGANTVAAPRVRTDVDANFLYGFAVVRPFAFVNASGKSRFAVIGRYDHYKPLANLADYDYHFLVGGLSYDISSKATLALDYQEQLPSSGTVLPSTTATGTVAIPPASLKTFFAHFVVNF
ncbi:MAG: hypothetical protein ACHQRK_05050 [Gemmatimonadales bacterium]